MSGGPLLLRRTDQPWLVLHSDTTRAERERLGRRRRGGRDRDASRGHRAAICGLPLGLLLGQVARGGHARRGAGIGWVVLGRGVCAGARRCVGGAGAVCAAGAAGDCGRRGGCSARAGRRQRGVVGGQRGLSGGAGVVCGGRG